MHLLCKINRRGNIHDQGTSQFGAMLERNEPEVITNAISLAVHQIGHATPLEEIVKHNGSLKQFLTLYSGYDNIILDFIITLTNRSPERPAVRHSREPAHREPDGRAVAEQRMTIKPGAIHLAAREVPAAESRCALRPTRPRRVRLSVGRGRRPPVGSCRDRPRACCHRKRSRSEIPVRQGVGRDRFSLFLGSVKIPITRMRPAGFEPATKGFKGPRVSTGLGLSHPPRPSAGLAFDL